MNGGNTTVIHHKNVGVILEKENCPLVMQPVHSF